MAENNKNMLAFRGGEKGFVGNYYAVWQDGLDGEDANQWAKRIGIRTSIAALRAHSEHGNAIYSQLVRFLWSIQKREEEKEMAWIQQKLNFFDRSGIDFSYLKQVDGAVSRKEIGLAYTLMVQANKDLQELKREVGKNGSSVSRLNKFWKAQFEDYFVEKLDEAFQRLEGGDLNANISIDQIIEGWIQELIQDSNVVPESLNYIRGTIEDGLLELFRKQGMTINSHSNLLKFDFKKFVGAKRVRKTKQSSKRSETLNGLMGRVRNTLNHSLQRGLSAEILAVGEGGRGHGSLSMSTGNILKNIKNELNSKFSSVQQKGDVFSIEAYTTEVSLLDYADQVYEAIQAGGEEGLASLEQQLSQLIDNTNDIYIVETNVKGYQSLRDIDFEREGSFYARMNNLYKMRDQFPQKSIDQLIFLLNNTMDGCVASHHKDLLGDYFSAVFAAWMWDDYTELFREMEKQDSIKRIRIFNSGGLYFSASQLMKRTLEDLENEAGSNSFIYAKITPPSFDPHAFYRDLKTKEGYSVEGIPGGEERQNILAKRWDAMKDKVMRSGKVSLNIRQKQLDELFGRLASFME